MKISARLDLRGLSHALARTAQALEAPALDAAADALADEVGRARERDGIDAPLLREQDERRRFVGANDPDSIARELGGPGQSPAPWLAPSLPAARAPMRAAALARVRDLVAVHAGKRPRAVARALSGMRRK